MKSSTALHSATFRGKMAAKGRDFKFYTCFHVEIAMEISFRSLRDPREGGPFCAEILVLGALKSGAGACRALPALAGQEQKNPESGNPGLTIAFPDT